MDGVSEHSRRDIARLKPHVGITTLLDVEVLRLSGFVVQRSTDWREKCLVDPLLLSNNPRNLLSPFFLQTVHSPFFLQTVHETSSGSKGRRKYGEGSLSMTNLSIRAGELTKVAAGTGGNARVVPGDIPLKAPFSGTFSPHAVSCRTNRWTFLGNTGTRSLSHLSKSLLG